MKGVKPVLVVDNGSMKSAPKAPTWLSKDARAEWNRVAPLLVERRILTKADLAGLENYCIAIGHVREAERHVQEHGQVAETFKQLPTGGIVSLGMKRNPSVGIVAEATNRARLLAAELGLTPVSRSRPSIRDESDDDDLLS